MKSQQDLVAEIQELMDAANSHYKNGRMVHAREFVIRACTLMQHITVKSATVILKSNTTMEMVTGCALVSSATIMHAYVKVSQHKHGSGNQNSLIGPVPAGGPNPYKIVDVSREKSLRMSLPSEMLNICCNPHQNQHDKYPDDQVGSTRFFKDEHGAFGTCDQCAEKSGQGKTEISKGEALEICLISDVMEV